MLGIPDVKCEATMKNGEPCTNYPVRGTSFCVAHGNREETHDHKAPAVRCLRIRKNGERCKAAPIRGGLYCNVHGGRLPIARRSAEYLLKAACRPAIGALLHTMSTTDDDYARIKAATALLDRSGLGPKATLDVSVAPGRVDYTEMTEKEILERKVAMTERLLEITTQKTADSDETQDGDVEVLPPMSEDERDLMQLEVEFSSLRDGSHPQNEELQRGFLESKATVLKGEIEKTDLKLSRMPQEESRKP